MGLLSVHYKQQGLNHRFFFDKSESKVEVSYGNFPLSKTALKFSEKFHSAQTKNYMFNFKLSKISDYEKGPKNRARFIHCFGLSFEIKISNYHSASSAPKKKENFYGIRVVARKKVNAPTRNIAIIIKNNKANMLTLWKVHIKLELVLNEQAITNDFLPRRYFILICCRCHHYQARHRKVPKTCGNKRQIMGFVRAKWRNYEGELKELRFQKENLIQVISFWNNMSTL